MMDRRTVNRLIATLAACASLACVLPVSAQSAETAAAELNGRALVASLRSGGYILYFRHAATDFGQNDDKMTGYEDCATQRNLVDRGRADARAIGASLRALAIPVGDVLASPFCRTMETAQPESPDRYMALRDLLSTPLPRGSNLVIVSHGNPFRAVAGGNYLAEGEAAVIEPRGKQGFRIVARVPLEEWRVLESQK